MKKFLTTLLFPFCMGAFISAPAFAANCSKLSENCYENAWSNDCNGDFQNQNKCKPHRAVHVFVNNLTDNLRLEVEDNSEWFTGFHSPNKLAEKKTLQKQGDDKPILRPDSSVLFSFRYSNLGSDMSTGYITLNVYQTKYDDGEDAGEIFLGKHRIAIRPQEKSGNKRNYVCSYFESAIPTCLQNGQTCNRKSLTPNSHPEPAAGVSGHLSCQSNNSNTQGLEMYTEIADNGIFKELQTSHHQSAKWFYVDIEDMETVSAGGKNIPNLKTSIRRFSSAPCSANTITAGAQACR